MTVCPRGYKSNFMLNSAEHRIKTAHRYRNRPYICEISGLDQQSLKFILLINVKMQTFLGILTFISRIKFSLSRACFITSGPGYLS